MNRKLDFRYEGIYNSQYKQNVQETVEYILERNYGETLTHETLGKLLGYRVDNEEEFRKYKSTMSRVKSIILPYGRILKSVAGIGYYILKPKQISSYCYRTYIQRTQRVLAKSREVLGYVDLSELSDERKLEHKEISQLSKDLIENTSQTIESSTYYEQRRYYDELED